MRNPMSLWRNDQFNPFREVEAMRREMERMFERPFWGSAPALPELSSQAKSWVTTPMADFDETPTHYLMTVDLPGIKKEEVKVEVHENELRVYGERKEEKKDASNHVTERFVGRFERRFGFSIPIETGKVEAAFEDGVLRIAAPKAGGKATTQIKIGESANDSKALKQLFGTKSSSESMKL